MRSMTRFFTILAVVLTGFALSTAAGAQDDLIKKIKDRGTIPRCVGRIPFRCNSRTRKVGSGSASTSTWPTTSQRFWRSMSNSSTRAGRR